MDILLFLKTNELSRKVFGKKEIKIIEKQVNGIKLTQSEKNRLSRDIRKKLQFIKKCSEFEEEFKLEKNQKNHRLIEQAKKVILDDKKSEKIEKIMLFGSFVQDKMAFRSDIDMAVVFDKINLRQATNFRKRIMGKISEKIDLQVFNTLPEKIKKSIMEKHEVIYEN